MDFYFWVMAGFIVIGFIVLVSMKKKMESKLALIIENKDNTKSKKDDAKPIIWWIIAATVWAIISIFFTIRLFIIYT